VKRVRLKHVALLVAGGTPRVDNPVFWADGDDGTPWVTIGDMSGRDVVTRTSRRLSDAGVAAISSTPAPAGTILYSMYASVGLVSRLGTSAVWNQAILGVMPRPGIDSAFLAYALDALRPTLGLYFRSNTQHNLNADVVGNLELAIPAEPEQRRIAEFLDAETARIDAMIGLRHRQARLLVERDAVVANRMLRPPAGEDWPVRRLSQLCDPARPVQYGIVLPGPNVQDGVLLVKGGDVKPSRLSPSLLARTTDAIESQYTRSRLQKRDLAFAIRGGVGDVELVPASLEGANITQDVARIAPLRDVDEHWLLHALRSAPVQAQVSAMITGATIKGINIGDLRRISLVMPPNDVQTRIGRALADSSQRQSRVAASIDRQIALLRERRQALIAAAVTGGPQAPITNTARASG
jgi:type I restriction enzyme S subunit